MHTRWQPLVIMALALSVFSFHNNSAAKQAATTDRLPKRLCRSLTWDHGKEMAEHDRFTADTGIPVFFCDPRSPWQRASNENANGLLRQHLPRTADLRRFSQAALDAIAAELNGRPRQTLGFQTPSQVLAEALR